MVLKGKHFSVLGLGCSSYPRFCAAADQMHALLTGTGATPLQPVVKVRGVGVGMGGGRWCPRTMQPHMYGVTLFAVPTPACMRCYVAEHTGSDMWISPTFEIVFSRLRPWLRCPMRTGIPSRRPTVLMP